jgi:hypothetical protein
MTSTVSEATTVTDVQAIREKLATETFEMPSGQDRGSLSYKDGITTTLRWPRGVGRDPLYPLEPAFSRDVGNGGETRFSSGEVPIHRAGHATAHRASAVTPTPGTPTRFVITAFYRAGTDASIEQATEL